MGMTTGYGTGISIPCACAQWVRPFCSATCIAFGCESAGWAAAPGLQYLRVLTERMGGLSMTAWRNAFRRPVRDQDGLVVRRRLPALRGRGRHSGHLGHRITVSVGGAPDAMRVARPARRAGRGNGPRAIPERRPGPTSTSSATTAARRSAAPGRAPDRDGAVGAPTSQ